MKSCMSFTNPYWNPRADTGISVTSFAASNKHALIPTASLAI